jgi:hypothetical protein
VLEVDGFSMIASVARHSLELHVGPLVPAGGEQLLGESEIPSLGSIIERLTDGHSMMQRDSMAGTLALELHDRPR